ncbi:tetraacyldisaccharide 4'-kinase [Adhaeribacter aquaticus]|uniref:tetraacyldisaccharide 4'-kinase n=1 Tax=Adhaeribacter aquaticus TaxID=299567 RepID=UPI0004797035|nr:tetraacyldisaccharide 4'-kinase [Adhaeribacter aquaticus]
MNFLKYPLLPFSLLYSGITCTRNWLYDAQVLESSSFRVPVICIGNLTVGGTGKTPHVEYLVQVLAKKQVAILSRGYKRQTTGFVLADETATAATIGDEPFQYYLKFFGVTVAVCEDRVKGINKLLQIKPHLEVVLLDDAYQHRPVKAGLNILITDYYRLFYQDYVLPAGRLRENRFGAKRADVILVSKCPEGLPEKDQTEITNQIKKYCKPDTPVYFTTYRYLKPVAFGKEIGFTKQIVLITGIAQPGPLLQYLKENGFEVVKHFSFPDHHRYKPEDLTEIINFAALKARDGLCFLTTQKDWTKLNSLEFRNQVKELPFFYLPIKVAFLAGQEAFNALITKEAN